ncbi:MAG: hypothetical protein IJO88_00350 [Oscillospiraceae bacterium]|nr:hypothetical protein [Oscillospiraceae bacterium]
MKAKTFLATVTLSAAAGAATILLMPKHSKFYRTAEDAAEIVKMEAGKMLDIMKK